jgi:hypothetical protein
MRSLPRVWQVASDATAYVSYKCAQRKQRLGQLNQQVDGNGATAGSSGGRWRPPVSTMPFTTACRTAAMHLLNVHSQDGVSIIPAQANTQTQGCVLPVVRAAIGAAAPACT